MNSAAVATKVEDVQGDGRWMSLHKRHCEDCLLRKPHILFIGDSLIQRMEDTDIWNNSIQPMHAVNAGVGGDSTQHVLWRIENGLLEKWSPKIVVVLVGTNNHAHSSDEIVEALEAIGWSIYNKSPEAKIIILGLLPRGEKPNPLREKIYQINYQLERIVPTIPNAYYLNPDPGLIRSNGAIVHEDMLDYLHLTRRGYKKFCVPVVGLIKEILGKLKQGSPGFSVCQCTD